MFPPKQQDGDAPIRATDSDALLARLSAVQKGYLSDPFVHLFVPRAHLQPPRPPLINIGTCIRSESIDRLVDAWFKLCELEGKSCQIVSLGAGSDTRYWRLATSHHKGILKKYIEADFAEITTKKAMSIRKNEQLNAILEESGEVTVANGGTSLRSAIYNLLAVDLRKDPPTALGPFLTNPNDGSPPLLDVNVPTLLLFECVLAYMQPSESSGLIGWFTDLFRQSAPLGVIVYEMFGLEDSFGRVMKNNLKARDIELPGAVPFTSLESLPGRFTEHGFKLSKALTLKGIKNTLIPQENRRQILQHEFLDEVEELDLVLDHYAITWAASWPEEGDERLLKWSSWGMKWAVDE